MNNKRSSIKLASRTVLLIYLLFLLWAVLFKFSLRIVEVFDFHIQGLNLIPFTEVTQDSWRDISYNFLLFIPFGLLLCINLKSASFWRKLKYILFFSLTVEIAQGIFAIGITDITDVITNTSGGLLGLLLYRLNHAHFGDKKVDRWATATIGVLTIVSFSGIYSIQLSHSRQRPLLVDPTVASTGGDIALSTDENVPLVWPVDGQAAVGTTDGVILARSFANERPRPTASMAKIITALAIMEKQPLEPGQTGPTYTVTKQDMANLNAHIAENGSVLPLQMGMKLTQYEAMQRMLIASDNNMADMLAQKTFGSKKAYVAYARDMLERMGLHQTVVDDASGFSSATVSTPSELVMIGIAALKHPVIAEIVGQQQARLPVVGTIKNTNQLLGSDGVIGIKTGTTDEAGSCLLFAARYIKEDGTPVTIVAVIMGEPDHTQLYSDSRQLLISVRQRFGLACADPDCSGPEL